MWIDPFTTSSCIVFIVFFSFIYVSRCTATCTEPHGRTVQEKVAHGRDTMEKCLGVSRIVISTLHAE